MGCFRLSRDQLPISRAIPVRAQKIYDAADFPETSPCLQTLRNIDTADSTADDIGPGKKKTVLYIAVV